MGTFEKVLIGFAGVVCLVTMVLIPLGIVASLGSLLAATQGQYFLAGAAAVLAVGALALWYLRKAKRETSERQLARVPAQSEPQE